MVQSHPKAGESAAAKSSLTPCILDDDPAQLEMLAALVASLGYESITTANPEEALKLVQYGRCRLVLADVHMPGMDGYQFLDAALRADWFGQEVRGATAHRIQRGLQRATQKLLKTQELRERQFVS